MPTKPYHVDPDKLPRQSRFGGLMQESAVVMDHALIKYAWAKPFSGEMTGRAAAPMKPDVHPWDQVILLMRGKVEVTLGDEGCEGTYTLEPGHLIYIPANMPHIGRVVCDEECFGIDIFAPVRADYLDMAQHQLEREKA